jgi:hypothetical protein
MEASTLDSGGNMRDAGPPRDAMPPAETGAPCPSVAGGYTVAISGLGCIGVDATAPECITQSGCDITFTSKSTLGPAINGTTTITSDGSFTNASLTEGSAMRTGCIGTWSASVMKVNCGGAGTTQSCTLTLTRKALVCG